MTGVIQIHVEICRDPARQILEDAQFGKLDLIVFRKLRLHRKDFLIKPFLKWQVIGIRT